MYVLNTYQNSQKHHVSIYEEYLQEIISSYYYYLKFIEFITRRVYIISTMHQCKYLMHIDF